MSGVVSLGVDGGGLDAVARDWVLRVMDSPEDDGVGEACAAWRDADPAHEAAFWKAYRAWNAVGSVGVVGSGDWRAEAEALRARGGRGGFGWGRWVAAPVGLAASVAAVVGFWAWGTGPAALDVATQVAETRVVALADGSRVTMGGKSAIEARVDRGARRVVLESGQAFFEVAHDPAHPFVVMAGDAEITVRGTKFDVRLVDGDVRVSVLEGRVEVRRRGVLKTLVGGGTADAVLGAGQKSELPVGAGAFEKAAPAPVSAGEWRTGRLFYADAPLSEILSDAGRYANVRIRVGDSDVGAMSLTMSYRAGDTEGLEQAIEAALPVRIEKRGDELVVLKDQ